MNNEIIEKIDQLKNPDIQNYLESKERLFLKTVSNRISDFQSNIELNESEKIELDQMLRKYKRFLK